MKINYVVWIKSITEINFKNERQPEYKDIFVNKFVENSSVKFRIMPDISPEIFCQKYPRYNMVPLSETCKARHEGEAFDSRKI